MFIAEQPHRYIRQVVGNGHCVAFVREATQAPHTSQWRRGVSVRNGGLPANVAIATFNASGRYANDTTGRSHAAILLGETQAGLRVLDQWVGRAVNERIIRFKGGSGLPVDDGDAYYVIEAAAPIAAAVAA